MLTMLECHTEEEETLYWDLISDSLTQVSVIYSLSLVAESAK